MTFSCDFGCNFWLEMGIGIRDWGLELGIGDWGFGIGDWELELGIGVGGEDR